MTSQSIINWCKTAKHQRTIKIILGIGIGLAAAWFAVEVFFPPPFPHMAF